MVAIINSDCDNRFIDARAFACPGLYRIVPANDGGICRVRVGLGELSSIQMRAIAATAQSHGNGILEFTNRANIQIRGMPLGDTAIVLTALAEAGLAPPERWADDARNVLINPLAGLDPAELFDVRPIAEAILRLLSSNAAHAALSPKFSIQVDGGGTLSVAEHAHDIWLLAVEIDGEGPAFKLGLASPVAYEGVEGGRVCAPGEAANVVAALVDEFIETGVRLHRASRLRDLLRVADVNDIWRRVEIRLGHPIAKVSKDRLRSRAMPVDRAPLGVLKQRDASRCAVAAVPALGRCDVAAFNAAADVADRFACSEIRLTPWRSFLIPNVPLEGASAALGELRSAGFIVHDGDPMAHRIACSGMVGCASALADVQGDARKLDAAFSGSVHLSGCGKSCAMPGAADVTLVAVGDGLYDLYCRRPSAGLRFGALIASHVDIVNASRKISELRA